MGFSTDYPNVPEWTFKDTGYHTNEMVKYQGHIFVAAFWAGSAPGENPADGWRLFDELYDVTTGNKTEQAKIIAYIPTWRKQEKFSYADDEMYKAITHGVIAFLMFSETNLGEFEPTTVNDVNAILHEVVTTGHRNGARILIALGGATDYGFLYLLSAIANNPAHPLLTQAVNNIVSFIKANNLDGVDPDLECWWDKNGDSNKDQGGRPTRDGAHPAGYGLTLLAQQLKQAMPDKLVSATFFATSWYGNNYDPQIADYVDWVGVMTYDLTGSWNKSPVGPHTALLKIRDQTLFAGEQQGAWPDGAEDNPIFAVEDSLWYWTNPFYVNWQGAGQKIPRHKLAAGVPIYGYDFAYGKEPDDLSGQVAPGYKALRYKDILSQFPDAHHATTANIKVAGSTPRPPFIPAGGDYPYARNLYFETPDTAVAKLNFLKNLGAQGVIIWELSNDVWENEKSIIKALYQHSGNPAVRPSLGDAFDALRYNQFTFLCTHNAFTNYEDARWASVSQSQSITNQLKGGVSALMLDTHFAEPGPGDLFGVIPEAGIYLLHGVNEHRWIAGSTYALPSRRLYQALNDVVSFLKENPRAIITVFLEDYTATNQLTDELNKVNGLREFLYDPDNDATWNARAKKEWPRRGDMIRWNKRLVIFSSKNHDNQTTKIGVAYDRDYTKQNYWSLGADGRHWDCESRFNQGVYEEDTTFAAPPLFVFEHHRDVPTVFTAADDNLYSKIMDRLENRCRYTAQQLPNFVAVDFHELPGGDNAHRVVAELNGRWLQGTPWIPANGAGGGNPSV